MSEVDEASQSDPAGYHFLTRVRSLPAVESLWGAATQTYSRVKRSTRLLSSALTTVEKTVVAIIERGKPAVLAKFSSQLTYLDGVACRGLEKLEEVYTTKRAKEIVADITAFGHQKYARAKEYGWTKVEITLSSVFFAFALFRCACSHFLCSSW